MVFSQRIKLAALISGYINRISPQIKLYQFTDPIEAASFAVEKDAYFGAILDIDSGACDDLKLVKILHALKPSLPMVFLSRSGRFAIEAFQYQIFDYLTLPIDKDRLKGAIEKLMEHSKSNNANEIYIKTFGAFEVVLGEITLPWKNSKTKELLALLVDSRGDNVSSEKIQKTLWPDADAEKAAASYHTTLHNLRKKLNSFGIGHLLEGSRGSQRANVDAFGCDLYDFERSVAEGTLPSYQRAFELYKGRYLENNSYTWNKFTMVRIDVQFEQICRYI